jgi:hypothetical protein
MKNAWYNAKRQSTKAGKRFVFGTWIETKEVKAASLFAKCLKSAWASAKLALTVVAYKTKTVTLQIAMQMGVQFTNKRFCSVEMVDTGSENPCFENEMIVDLI